MTEEAAMGRLDGKTALVTGAAQGLGEGIARRFASEGAVVVLADRLDAGPVAASLPVRSDGRKSRAVQLDVTDKDAVEAAIASVAAEHGRLDILVNNAGTYRVADIVDDTDESFHAQFAVNTYSVFVACRAAGRLMKQQRWGRIINTASQLGKVGRASYGLYSASKGAVILMTQALALELGPYGVTANCICPGSMATALLSDANGRPGLQVAAELGVDVNTAFADYINAKIPVGRLGEPADMGSLATWLASDEGGFMTGSAVNLTGGEQVFF
jgi:NAD(P)-dependent dehydrogenase (short-subunit alcohol dehydrogenase family)